MHTPCEHVQLSECGRVRFGCIPEDIAACIPEVLVFLMCSLQGRDHSLQLGITPFLLTGMLQPNCTSKIRATHNATAHDAIFRKRLLDIHRRFVSAW